MPNLSEQANALTPGDWSSLRDLIRQMAADLDKLKSKPGIGGNGPAGGGANPPGSAPAGPQTH